MLIGAAIGFSVTGLRAGAFKASALSPALEGSTIEVTGQVLAMPQQAEDAVRFRFGVESARLDGAQVQLPPQIYLGWYSGFGARQGRVSRPSETSGDVTPEDSADQAEALLQLQRQPQPMRAGERWQMSVKLKAPHGNANPHGFDYELWLWEQGIQATGYVRAGVADAPPRRLAESWRFPVERARQAVREDIFQRVADRQLAGILAALVVGDQAAIERADWDVFRATGVAHLMSISGLHITLFAWLAGQLIGCLWRASTFWTSRLCMAWPASKAAAWGGLLLATAYSAFAGWGVPAQRTVLMLAVVVALSQSGRRWAWPQVWLLAMAAVVVLDPWALLQAGFWLSFVAVGVLFAADSGAGARDAGEAKSGSRARMSAAIRALANMAREQWVVTLALTPLSLLLFNQVSVVGLFANALAIPWVTLLVTPLALMGVALPALWPLAAWFTGLLADVLRLLSGWPLATVSTGAAPVWLAAAGVGGGLLLAMRLPWHARLLGLPLLLPVLLWQPPRPPAGAFELLGADIGQGNAVLVRTATHTLLYDAGPRFSRESDAGHRVLVPLLRALDERVDVLMLSHRDSDHVGGAAAVLAMQPKAALISSIEDSHELQQLRRSERCVAGQAWQWDGVGFRVLHPLASDYEATTKPNAVSCVLRIEAAVGRGNSSEPAGPEKPMEPMKPTDSGEAGAVKAVGAVGAVGAVALLVGDIELAQERALLAREPLKANFLLVPHHGSKTSSSAAFLDAVQPDVALAQAGYRNRFNHPVDSVVARYLERGISFYRSDGCGAATWQSLRPGQIDCQRSKVRRYWHHRLEGAVLAQPMADSRP